MAAKRGPESFIERQRERAKQQEQVAKLSRKRERSAEKKDARFAAKASPIANLQAGPLRLVRPLSGQSASLR